MASGFKELQINTQERAVSVDINRLQKFKSADEAEDWRYLIDVTGSDDLDTGVIVEPNTLETPLRAEIMGGLLVRPQAGTLNLLVDPGILKALAPDALPDDSNYKYVRDPGVTIAGSLVMTANAGMNPRIDVIEVQVSSIVSETDNRDIFNPANGLFSASTVTKAHQHALTYRVRAGTIGGGMPANQQGWMPLMVALVPNGVSLVDGMTFWDVRPVVTDRAIGISALSQDYPTIQQLSYQVDGETTAGQAIATGKVQAVIGSKRVGGMMRRGTPGADVNSVDLLANVEPGFVAPAAGGWIYTYLVTPFGLPRWARYTATAPFLPRSPRGILVTSTTPPKHLTGAPTVAISLPTSTSLGGSSTSAVCISAIRMNVEATPRASTIADGRTMWSSITNLSNTATPTAGGAAFTVTPGTDYPTNAKALWVSVQLIPQFPANVIATFSAESVLRVFPSGVGTHICEIAAPLPVTVNATTTAGLTLLLATPLVRIPIPVAYPTATLAPWTLAFSMALSALTAAGAGTALTYPAGCAALRVHGWEL